MTSLKARILIGLMRNRHLFKGKLHKEVFDYDEGQVLKFRASCEKGAERFGKIAKGIEVKPEIINLVRTEWLIPENPVENKLLFYVHGGGYVSGSCNDHRSIVSKITKMTGITTLLYEYGLAPENPYPAAVDDTVNIYKSMLDKGYSAENIITIGESAGGGLNLAMLLALKEKNLPLPKAAVAISPWTDLSCSGDSYTTKNKVSVAPSNCWKVFSHYYVGKNNVHDPYISPLYGDLKGLPPLFINSGEADELYDDGLSFYNKAFEADVNVSFTSGKGMPHCYPLLAPMFKEAIQAMDEIVEFIKKQLLTRSA